MENLKLLAVDIDGVILKDTFSPVLRQLVLRHGGSYGAEVERNVFSRNQLAAASYIIAALDLKLSQAQLIDEYFALRAEYLSAHDGGLNDGALAMIQRLQRSGLPMVCYGGLERGRIHADFDYCTGYFEQYICTNAFRPGMEEICNMYSLQPAAVLFIDDVNTVAECCKRLGAGFIGVPPRHSWGWQAHEMSKTGVRYAVADLAQIDLRLIKQIDGDVGACFACSEEVVS